MGSGSSKASNVASPVRGQHNKQPLPKEAKSATNGSQTSTANRQPPSAPSTINGRQASAQSTANRQPPSAQNAANGPQTSAPKNDNVSSLNQQNETKQVRPLFIKERTIAFEEARKRISSSVTRKADVQKKFHRGFSVAKNQAKKEKCTKNPLLLGDSSIQYPPTAKIVRIFTSSTFTDTENERNGWMSYSYPRIQSFCNDHGYQFQVVDMRWGIRDEASDDHSATELCLRELEQCQKLSTGPNFVSLLSHKYGYKMLNKNIEAKEFEQLLEAVEAADDQKLLTKWYLRDDNAIPPVYVLQRVSIHLPDFISPKDDDRNVAKNDWSAVHDRMQDILATAAAKCLSPEKARNYLVSVTEKEVKMGLLDVKNPGSSCMWFRRNLLGIENDTPSKPVSRFIDCRRDGDDWKPFLESRQLLSQLKDDRMSKVLPPKNIITYDLNWIPGGSKQGINPRDPQHSQYLMQIKEDLITCMNEMIEKAIMEREKQEMVEPILEEVKQHMVFCQDKCREFQGRDDILQEINAYITGSSQNPLVIHGSSGCGKTSIMAMAAKLTKTWSPSAAVMIRFLGTTVDSSTIGPLLKSLVLQIRMIYGQECSIPENLEELKDEFEASFNLPIADIPLVIFLDSLDQLDTADGARGLSWLPINFSENVKIVVSTLEERQYETFPKLVGLLPDDMCFVNVPDLSVRDARSIISSWLKSQHRSLTTAQNDIVVKAFNTCPVALFLKLSLDEACTWSSFTPTDHTVLQKSVRDSINSLFSHLEGKYGDLFVTRALGYLTVSKHGLSESELEDILSCDDDVLNDVYQYWTPPFRRLPPLLLVRLKTDLNQYLVERGTDGIRVMYWYHRQFIEAARDRYCTTENQIILHSAVADFFAGTWSNGNKKPYINKKTKKEGEEDRLVAAQPLKFKDKYNYRKLGHLPYHRIKAGQLELVKSECLCNFQFLQTKLVAMTYRRVFDDLNLARNTFLNDKELALIADAFNLSEYALSHDPNQLAPHMIDRLSKEKVVSQFVDQCKQTDIPYLASSDEVLIKPGGELVYTMTGHTSSVKSLDVTADGSTAITCGQFGDDIVRTWSLKKGKLLKEYDNLPNDPENVYFADKDKRILIHYTSEVVVINILDGTRFTKEIPNMSQLCVCGTDRSLFGTFLNRDCTLFRLSDGEVQHKFSFESDKILFDIRSCVSATSDYAALSHVTDDEFYVINITMQTLSSSKRETSGSYSIDAIVITPSQKTVICASFLQSTIRLHDIKTLNVLKTIQTRDEPYEEISNFHVTKDGKCLYFPCYKHVIFIDLKEEKEIQKFGSHPDSISDVQLFGGDKAITITHDSIVRVWDMSESNKPNQENNTLQEHNIVKISEFRPLPNSRYVVMIGNVQTKDDYYMFIYDLAEKCIVQSTELDEGSHLLEVVDNNTVLVLPMSLKPKTIDLQTMTIKTVFQGKVCERCKLYQMLKGGQEFMCLTRGRRNIKVYNTGTGKVIKIHKSPQGYRIDYIFTNKDGSTIVAKADETFIIFDVILGKTTKVTASDLKMEVIGYVSAVSPNGNHGILSACKLETAEIWESEPMGFLWEVKKGKKLFQLVDSEYCVKYKRSGGPATVALDEIKFLDDEKVVSSHEDFIIRIWKIESGDLLHRLTGHTRQAMLTVPFDGPYFLSYGYMDEELIKLWDRKTFQCLSSFKFDTTISKLRFCADNETFVTSTENPINIVHWNLHGRLPAKLLKDYPKLQKKNYNIQLEIEADEDAQEEEDDPDTDLNEPENSDDDCSDLEMEL